MGIVEAPGFFDRARELLLKPKGVRAIERVDRDSVLFRRATLVSSRVLDSLGITNDVLGVDPMQKKCLDACFASQMHMHFIRDPARSHNEQEKNVLRMYYAIPNAVFLDKRMQAIYNDQAGIFHSKKIKITYLFLDDICHTIQEGLLDKISTDRIILNRFRNAFVDSLRGGNDDRGVDDLVRLISSTNASEKVQETLSGLKEGGMLLKALSLFNK